MHSEYEAAVVSELHGGSDAKLLVISLARPAREF